MTRLLDRLETLGLLRPIDAALGRLLARKSVKDGELIGLAAALVSVALAEGHSGLPLSDLPGFVAELAHDSGVRALDDLPDPEQWRRALLTSPLVARASAPAAALVLDAYERLYLRRYFVYEQTVASALAQRLPHGDGVEDRATSDAQALRTALARCFDASAHAHEPDPDQQRAALLALRSRLLIVSGGPGSGKTTAVLRVLELIVAQARANAQPMPRIALAAPTGKAAARLTETLRVRANDALGDAALPIASTVHRLLGIGVDGRYSRHDRAHPLPYDLIVIDEASMLDLALAARLCAALRPTARLILLGDHHQLAAVEAGHVFAALCRAASAANGYSPAVADWLSNVLATAQAQRADAAISLADAFVELHGNHRFAAHGAIGQLAGALRDGNAALVLRLLADERADTRRTGVTASALAQRIAHDVLPHFVELTQAPDADSAFALAERFRVLCAQRHGPFGSVAINAAIEHALRRRTDGSDARGWYPGRLVVVVANDYRLGLFNGDIGVALPNAAHGRLDVWFRSSDGGLRALPPLVLDVCEPAYALTVHKAQGSEFDDVVVVLPEHDSRVLGRELLYTAVTRARRKVDVWASSQIIAMAVARSVQRWSGLAQAIDAYAESRPTPPATRSTHTTE